MTDPNTDPNTGVNTGPTTGPATDPGTDPGATPTTGAPGPVTLSKSALPAPPTSPTASVPPAPPAPSAPPAAAPPRRRRRPLFPTILWGALMLALAAFIAARELAPGELDLVTWMLTAVVAIGILLVVAGIAAAARRVG